MMNDSTTLIKHAKARTTTGTWNGAHRHYLISKTEPQAQPPMNIGISPRTLEQGEHVATAINCLDELLVHAASA